MSDTVQKLRLYKRLQEMFPPDFDSARDYGKHSEEEYLDMLEKIRKYIRGSCSSPRLYLLHFLYSGCLKFDRFIPPTPFVVSQAQHRHFNSFLQALIKAENDSPINTARFMLHAVRGRIYRENDGIPLRSIAPSIIEGYRREVENIPEPNLPAKRHEFLDEKKRCLAIIDGLADASLVTMIKTRIPFILHASKLSIMFKWKDINVMMNATPTFTHSSGSFVTSEGAIQQVGPSRWQTGHTDLELRFEALIDCDAFEEPLHGLHGEERPIDGWPKCFSEAFHIIRDVAWRLRLEHGGERQWIPAPRDIGDIEWEINSSSQNSIECKKKCSPAALMRIFIPSTECLTVDLGDLSEPLWSEQCRSLAIMYFEMGQREESLFWLNVGVEALFEERFREIGEMPGFESLEKDLSSPKTFWAQSEEIVAAQFPDLAGKINWPAKEVHVSIFAKLKFLHNTVSMKTTLKDLQRRYSQIQKHRNSLFHGRRTSAVSVEVVTKAIESFDWINQNFKVQTNADA